MQHARTKLFLIVVIVIFVLLQSIVHFNSIPQIYYFDTNNNDNNDNTGRDWTLKGTTPTKNNNNNNNNSSNDKKNNNENNNIDIISLDENNVNKQQQSIIFNDENDNNNDYEQQQKQKQFLQKRMIQRKQAQQERYKQKYLPAVQQQKQQQEQLQLKNKVTNETVTNTKQLTPKISNATSNNNNAGFTRIIYHQGRVQNTGMYSHLNNPNSDFYQGYKPTGGLPPRDNADFLWDAASWENVDNATCIDTTTNSSTAPVYDWLYRAPYFILIGAMKCGTHAVTVSLWEHESCIPTRHYEMHFFTQRARRSSNGISQRYNQEAYAEHFEQASVDITQLQTNKSKFSFDSAPRYILSSDRIPALIMCTTPWAKLVAILRDPITRVESHYRFQNQARQKNNKPMVDWDTWIRHDIELLLNTGVLPSNYNETTTTTTHDNNNNINNIDFYGSPQEYFAWKTYQRSPNSQMIVGRGLYVIQLEQYYQTMKQSNKPASDLYVMVSERFKNYRQEEYNKLLQFLKLSPHVLNDTNHEEHATLFKDEAIPMPSHIREMLLNLYEPYTQRLYKLLDWNSSFTSWQSSSDRQQDEKSSIENIKI